MVSYGEVRLLTEAARTAGSIKRSSQLALPDTLIDIKEQWLGTSKADLQPFERNTQAFWDNAYCGGPVGSLLEPNGFVASLEVIEQARNGSVVEVGLAYTSLRNILGKPLAVDPVEEDCRSIGFTQYPLIAIYKMFLGYAYSQRPEAQAGLDFYDWSKETTGDYLSGGAAYFRRRESAVRCIGATGMVYKPRVMEKLRDDLSLAQHFDSEPLVSFRGSGAADDTMAKSLATTHTPTVQALLIEHADQVSRGICLN